MYQFLYGIICCRGCFEIQINDQGSEFVNEVNTELHKLTGVEQRITSAHHAQSNGILERLNRAIKNSLGKLLENNSSKNGRALLREFYLLIAQAVILQLFILFLK